MFWQRVLMVLHLCLLALVSSVLQTTPLQAQQRTSTCLAIARSIPKATFASFTPTALEKYQTRITFKGHSTYLIESSSGVTIATDFTGFYGTQNPKVVTMNHAHDTHYTDYPDPEIQHVLKGWGEKGEAAKVYLTVDDVLIRNVTTDILIGDMRINDDNSIFIFEVDGLCIGHLGHLHHDLTDEHFAKIGRLDVVMVPIDGAMTLSLGGMAKIVKRLRSRVILPMHTRGWATPADFITMLGDGFDYKYLKTDNFTVSLNDLPSRPTVLVPNGL